MKKIESLLLRSFDEELTFAEKEELDNAIKKSPKLQNEKKSLESLRNLLQERDYSFHYGFSDKVVRNIQNKYSENTKLADFYDYLYAPFRWIALSGTSAIAISLIVLFFEGSLSLDGLLGLDDLTFYDTITFNFYDYK